MKKNKMLIHACCGPCLVGVYEYIENNLSEFSLDCSITIDVKQ